MIRVLERLADISNRRENVPVLRGLPARYQVVRELGYGGMAVVYLARDKQLDRDVAIKVLHTALSADKASVARLSHEARLVAQLQHPNIVSIYDLERLRDKSVALIMQYVRGRTLRAIIDEQGRLSAVMTERVLSEIAKALVAAHRRGIIHRDVKPENIYLDQESGRALLADFGIAQAPLIQSGLTMAGEAVGTPNYMSPEQIAGTDVDGRSDLYSLGLVGYEMLTGEQPWAGESLYNVLHKQQHESLPSLAKRRPDVPLGLVRALEQAMRKDRAERPRSGEVLLKLLREGGAGGPTEVEAAGDPSTEPVLEAPSAPPDAPTVRYRRPGVAYEGDADGNGSEVIPIQLFPWESEPEGSEEAPPTRAATPVKVSNPTFVGVKTSRLKSGQLVVDGKQSRPTSKWRRTLGVIAASAAAACTVAIVGFFGLGLRPTAQAESLQPDPPAAEATQEPTELVEETAPQPSRGASAQAPVRSSSGSSSGSRSAREEFEARGDLTDVVCQPLGNETVEEWSRRVPAYCRM